MTLAWGVGEDCDLNFCWLLDGGSLSKLGQRVDGVGRGG